MRFAAASASSAAASARSSVASSTTTTRAVRPMVANTVSMHASVWSRAPYTGMITSTVAARSRRRRGRRRGATGFHLPSGGGVGYSRRSAGASSRGVSGNGRQAPSGSRASTRSEEPPRRAARKSSSKGQRHCGSAARCVLTGTRRPRSSSIRSGGARRGNQPARSQPLTRRPTLELRPSSAKSAGRRAPLPSKGAA